MMTTNDHSCHGQEVIQVGKREYALEQVDQARVHLLEYTWHLFAMAGEDCDEFDVHPTAATTDEYLYRFIRVLNVCQKGQRVTMTSGYMRNVASCLRALAIHYCAENDFDFTALPNDVENQQDTAAAVIRLLGATPYRRGNFRTRSNIKGEEQ